MWICPVPSLYHKVMLEGIALVAIPIACLLLILFLAPPAATATDREQVARGKALFTGAEPLAKGGAPCAACHPFRALGITGGNLAADLTDVYEGMGEEGLTEVLKSLDFPVMKKIYADRPLTHEEVGTLITFTRVAAAGERGGASLLFPLTGVGVFVCCLAILVLYRRRIG